MLVGLCELGNSPRLRVGRGPHAIAMRWNAAACGQLEEWNARHLEEALEYLKERYPEVVERAQPISEIRWELEIEGSADPSGRFDWNTRTITLARGYANKGALVETLAHELLHAGQGPLRYRVMTFEDLFWWGLGKVSRYEYGPGYLHLRVYDQAVMIRAGDSLR